MKPETTQTFHPNSLPCFDFINEDGEKQKVTAIIAPIRITKSGNGWEISWACSRALSCKNQTCRYSKTSKNNTVEGLNYGTANKRESFSNQNNI
jgi:hypothetical protein